VIGVEWGRRARDTMTAAGADVTFRESPMPHTIDPAFLADRRPWLAAL
jgi:predicted esterase